MSREYIAIKARIERAMAEARDIGHSVKIDRRFFNDIDILENSLKQAARNTCYEQGNLVLQDLL